jgi:molecular chaperone GrpE
MSDDTKTGAPEGAPEATLVPDAEEIMANAERDAGVLDALRRENEELRQQMLRALAEAENVRRRAQRDVADARQYAVTSFARDLLNVADNFHRAMGAVDGAHVDQLAPELKGVLDGIRMTERELASVFERHGIKSIDPTGQRFDPNRHQAMFEIENTTVPAGTVLQVMQLGSTIGDRVLRPAMVGVSRGGPKADAPAGGPAANDGE